MREPEFFRPVELVSGSGGDVLIMLELPRKMTVVGNTLLYPRSISSRMLLPSSEHSEGLPSKTPRSSLAYSRQIPSSARNILETVNLALISTTLKNAGVELHALKCLFCRNYYPFFGRTNLGI